MAKIYLPLSVRKFVEDRAAGLCEYCKSPAGFATQSFVIEHIVPLAKEGGSELTNLAWACQGCKGHKFTKTEAPDPLTGQASPLFNPRTQNWKEHFDWDENFTQIIGLTPIGRATVDCLRLNRPPLIRLRTALFLLGEHPPTE
ncbi:MAG: HNH endonuclease [Saprospiraceae bacterium]